MAFAQFKPTEPVPVTSEKRQTFDAQYWRGLELPITIKEYGAVTNVCFQPSAPNYFVVSASNRVEIYNPDTNELVKSFSRFPKAAYGATFRSDGKLLVAGNEDGRVRLFDIGGRVALRMFKGHQRATHVTKFHNMVQVFSASDDNTVRIWDIATEKCVNMFDGHEDYIRSGCGSKTSENLVFTGSYDHTVRMFDTRTNNASIVINHGSPVESVLAFPSGSILLSAGGNSIKVWDILQGGKQLATVSHHHKTITCMCFNHDCTRLLSAGLDRHVKIYDVSTYSVVHNIDYPAAILGMDVSQDEDRTLVVGMVDKMLSIRHRKKAVVKDEDKISRRIHQKRRLFSIKNDETYIPNAGDVTISHVDKKGMAKYDEYFRKFNHTKALDVVLQANISADHPEVTIAVIQELIRRGTIHSAVAGRTDQKLDILLKFIIKNISNINFTSVLTELTDIIIDVYSDFTEDFSTNNIHFFQRLKKILDQEVQLQFELEKISGCIQTIVRSNAQTIHLNAKKNNAAT